LDRAEKLTVGLSDEKVRWGNDIKLFTFNEKYIPGDSMIGSAMVAYAGPFTQHYRQNLESFWVK